MTSQYAKVGQNRPPIRQEPPADQARIAQADSENETGKSVTAFFGHVKHRTGDS
jgi:hypothetical protein